MSTKEFCEAIAHSLRRLADRIESQQHTPCYIVPQGTRVYDTDTGEQIKLVLEVDGLAGEVLVAAEPVRADVGGSIVTETLRFEQVTAERDADGRIMRINCSGRQP